MICFEVWVNGEKICLAGVGDDVLACILDGGRPSRGLKSNLHVGGLVNEEHVRWTEKRHDLEVGDEVTIKIVEADTADEPIERRPREDRRHRLKRVEHQLSAARALLPSPLVEDAYLASMKGFEELLAQNELKLAVDVLGALGELNNCPPEFWKELLPAALDLNMYDQAIVYRERTH